MKATSRHASLGWGLQRDGQDLLCSSLSLSLSCLLQSSCCISSEPPKLSFCPSWSHCWWSPTPRPRVREPFLFHSGAGPILTTKCNCRFWKRWSWLKICFSLILPSYMVIFLAFLVRWDLLPAFCMYSMRIVTHVHVFLMYLWKEGSSMCFHSTILIQLLSILYMGEPRLYLAL